MALLNLLIGCGLIAIISGAILIMQLLEVVQKCAVSLRPDYPNPVASIRYHSSLPDYLRIRLENRLKELPPEYKIDYALAIAAEWDTDELACVVIQLDSGEIILGTRPYTQ